MKYHSNATRGRSLTAGLLTILAFLLLHSAATTATEVPVPFTNLSYSGRYACRISSDFGGEQAVILLVPDGTGKFAPGSTKTLVTPDKLCATLPCSCVYSLGAGSTYEVNADGTGTAVMEWVPAAHNAAQCFGAF